MSSNHGLESLAEKVQVSGYFPDKRCLINRLGGYIRFMFTRTFIEDALVYDAWECEREIKIWVIQSP
jgi:hypothetical protein